jgi:phthiocerol/phenolphthiocerol synthesis type-I polyketide synthase E
MSQLSSSGLEIAVIGMAGRFPGAATIDELWRNLCAGVESISRFTDAELIAAGVDPALLGHPGYVKAGAILDDVEQFDAEFFGFNAREAEITDPQHRVFLECAWEALEAAGCDPARATGGIGIYAGCSMNTYALSNLLYNPAAVEAAGEFQTAIANLGDHLATRVSYKLDLHGSSFTVQTACSTSLVAVHLACQSLLSGESDIALAGGVSIGLPQRTGYLHVEGGVRSRDGHCRPFDARADGTVSGQGVGVVVLERLEEALARGAHVHAVIRGTAVNNDGARKVGYTAPSVDGQARVIGTALAVAGVEASTIGYVEAHGTGTPLGDPVEMKALTRVFAREAFQPESCVIGSIKSNLGHLDAAAGVTSLIKTVQAIEHGRIPPSLHFDSPNPELGLERGPFVVATQLRDWPLHGTPRRAGVSSFGIGGTNAHVVVEEAPSVLPSGPSRDFQVLVWSARTEGALDQVLDRHAARLQGQPGLSLPDVAWTLQNGRREFPWRASLVCRNTQEAIEALTTRPAPRVVRSAAAATGATGVVFMLPGQGAQHLNMGRELYRQEAVFRDAIDRCAAAVIGSLAVDLRELLFAEGDSEAAANRLRETRHAQPALFAVEYALASLWMSWGVKPVALIGHSLGEYVAACLAEVFTLEEALRLVCARGQLMQQTPAGAMLAVALDEDAVRPLLGEHLEVAALNGPASTVVSGPLQSIEGLQRTLGEREVHTTRLQTSHAFHSASMDGALSSFTALAGRTARRPPRIPCVSNLTGQWLTDADACDPDYWARHLRQPVRFADGVHTLVASGHSVFLEVGPGRTLSTLLRQAAPRGSQSIVETSLPHGPHPRTEQAHVLRALGRLWTAGVNVDWTAFSAAERRRRVVLPTYPFERRRYWVDPIEGAPDRPGRSRRAPGPSLLAPAWTRRPRVPGTKSGAAPVSWVVLGGRKGVLAALVDRLRAAGHEVNLVASGSTCVLDAKTLEIRSAVADDYVALVRWLRERRALPDVVVYGLGLDDADVDVGGQAASDCRDSFYSLLSLVQAFGREGVFKPMRLEVLTTGSCDVTGCEPLKPFSAVLQGLSMVAAQEYPHLVSRVIDIDEPIANPVSLGRLFDELVHETAEPVVALRGSHRWLRQFEPLPSVSAATAPCVRDNGVYLVIGGLGHVGLTMAEALAARAPVRLVLAGRSQFPDASTWDDLLQTATADNAVRRAIHRLRSLEQQGNAVTIARADVASVDAVRTLVDGIAGRFGQLNGVVHAAGTSGEEAAQAIADMDGAHVERQFAAKVEGAKALAYALRDRPVDFCLLTSSLSVVLGGLGFGAYAAANHFLDTFAALQDRGAGTRWISVDWDGWTPPAGAPTPGGITTAQASEVVGRVLSLDVGSQVAVVVGDLQTRMTEWINPGHASAIPPSGGVRHPRPALARAFVAPRNDVEQAIATIWCELLGVERVGVEDEFFELGGHSLLATQLVSRLRTRFGVDLPLRSLFEATTVAALAERLMAYETMRGQVAATARLRAMVEGLSADEVRALLERKRQAPNPALEGTRS